MTTTTKIPEAQVDANNGGMTHWNVVKVGIVLMAVIELLYIQRDMFSSSSKTTTSHSVMIAKEKSEPKQQQEQHHWDESMSSSSSLPPSSYYHHYNRRTMTGSWIGNSWTPPYPWRLFSANELRSNVFPGKRILWLGDSTARRASMTLFNILNGTTTDAPAAFAAATEQQHIPVPLLERDINLNKHKQTEPCSRQWFNMNRGGGPTTTMGSIHTNATTNTVPKVSICRNIRTTPNGDGHGGRDGHAGDVSLVRINCLPQLQALLQDEITNGGTLISHFDVIVVSLGVWYAVPKKCTTLAKSDKYNNNETTRKQTENTQRLIFQDLITRILSQLITITTTTHPHVKVIWRTSGWWNGQNSVKANRVIQRFNEAVMNVMEEHNEHEDTRDKTRTRTTTMTRTTTSSSSLLATSQISYVNWGDAIAPRSFNEARIEGDSVAHYGLEPRLVLIQMIANELLAMDKRRRSRN